MPFVPDEQYLTSPSSAASDSRPLRKKVWDALTVPEKKSREGLNMITEAVTPSMEDIEAGKVGIPGIAARAGMEALSEVAPSFVSRGAIATGGLLRGAGAVKSEVAPAVKFLGRWAGKGLEGISGTTYKTPGLLSEVSEKPISHYVSLLRTKKDAAKPLYEAAKSEIPEGMNLFKGMYKPEQILDKATEIVDKGGKLEPAEALMVRKAIDSLMKSGKYVKDELLAMRGTFDEMAKASKDIAKADPVVARGIKGEALRTLSPLNKTGTPSKFQIGSTMAGGIAAGVAGHPLLALLPFVQSPAVQGLGAAGFGVGTRAASKLAENPKTGAAISALMQQLFSRNE